MVPRPFPQSSQLSKMKNKATKIRWFRRDGLLLFDVLKIHPPMVRIQSFSVKASVCIAVTLELEHKGTLETKFWDRHFVSSA
jgi:hypothetical protein